MFHHISGTLTHSAPTTAVIEAGGIGYELNISLTTHSDMPQSGKNATLLCHFAVSENSQALYGFATDAERKLFRALIAISGVGPSKAMVVLSSTTPEEFIGAIEAEDLTRLKRIKGLGPKTAQRLIVELKGSNALASIGATTVGGRKGVSSPAAAMTDLASTAVQALQTLGLTPREAVARVDSILKKNPELDLEELIRSALQ